MKGIGKIIEKWDEFGKSQVITMFQDAEKFEKTCLEIVKQVVKSKLSIEQFMSTLPPSSSFTEDSKSSLLNVVWLLDFDCSEAEKKVLLSLVRALFQKEIISKALMRKKLDIGMLDRLNLIDMKKYTKQKKSEVTRKYSQQKYNLMSEESEGYSKLLFELSDIEGGGDCSIEKKIENLKTVIGTYSLDPNRVFDIILDVFENDFAKREKYIHVIQQLYNNRKYFLKLVFLKFYWYSARKILDETPRKLFILCAYLIKENVLSISDLYPALKPSDEDMYKRYKLLDIKNRENFAKKNMKFTLPYSQKIQLLSCMLEAKDVENSFKMMKVMNPVYFSNYPKLFEPLVKLLKETVAPYEEQVSREFVETGDQDIRLKKSTLSIDSFNHFWNYVIPMVMYLGPRLGKSMNLMTKVVRIVHKFVTMSSTKPNIVQLACSFLLALSVSSAVNHGLCNEIWKLLESLGWKQRFEVYAHSGKQPENNIMLHIEFSKTRKLCSDIMKKVCTENLREMGKKMSKLFATNPLSVADTIIHYLAYDVMVSTIVDLLRYSNPMIIDILVYKVLNRLNIFTRKCITKFGDDGYTESVFMKNYCNFLAGCCLRFSHLDSSPIYDHLVVHMKLSSWIDLYLLREIIRKVSNEDTFITVKEENLDATTGGHLLRIETGFVSSEMSKIKRGRRGAIDRLRQWLLSNNGQDAINLLVMIAKLKKSVLFLSEERKMFRKLMLKIDNIHETFLLLLQFLKFHTKGIWDSGNDMNGIEFIVPPIGKLLAEGIPYSTVFKIVQQVVHFGEMEKSLGKYNDPVIRNLLPKPITTNGDVYFLFSMFWMLSAYDIHVPIEAYKKKSENIKQTFEKEKAAIFQSDKKERVKKKKIRKLLEESELLIKKLNAEKEIQVKHVESTKKFLLEKFQGKKISIPLFIQYCVFPRCSFSTSDALYCAYFVECLGDECMLMNTYQYLRRVIESATNWFLCSSTNESLRTSRYLKYQLIFMRSRLKDNNIYKSNGSQQKMTVEKFELFYFRVLGEFTHRLTTALKNPKVDVSTKGNLLYVLSEIKSEFPEYDVHGTIIQETLVAIEKEFQENDALFKSYIGFLSRKIQNGELVKRKETLEDEEHFYREKLLQQKKKEKEKKGEKKPEEETEKKPEKKLAEKKKKEPETKSQNEKSEEVEEDEKDQKAEKKEVGSKRKRKKEEDDVEEESPKTKRVKRKKK